MDGSDDDHNQKNEAGTNAPPDAQPKPAAIKKMDTAELELWLAQQWQRLYGKGSYGPLSEWYLDRRSRLQSTDILNTSLIPYLLLDIEQPPPLTSILLLREPLDPDADKPFFNNDATWVSRNLKTQTLVNKRLSLSPLDVKTWHRGSACFSALPQAWCLTMVGERGCFSIGATIRDFEDKDLSFIAEIQRCFMKFVSLQRWLENNAISYHLDYGSHFKGEIEMAGAEIQLQPVEAKLPVVYRKGLKSVKNTSRVNPICIPVRGWDSGCIEELNSKLHELNGGGGLEPSR